MFPSMKTQTADGRDMLKIIVYGMALGFAGMIASLETVRSTATRYSIDFSWRTLGVFAVAFCLSVPCFRVIFQGKRGKMRTAAIVAVVLAGFGSFLYPLRFLSHEKLLEVLTGLGFAAIGLCIIGGFLSFIARCLEADSKRANRKR